MNGTSRLAANQTARESAPALTRDSARDLRHGHDHVDLARYLSTYAAGARSRLLGRFVCIRLAGTATPEGYCDRTGIVQGVDRTGLVLEVAGDVGLLVPWASVELVEFVDDEAVPA